ncbi:MAG: adenylate/guanylate cyclase domain-containing protein [Deltaproteobacteria bacterium]|nr:adenylate/guanylate cyclase domain-containing protein [Deltaproteobacteria bacterium]
MSRLFTAVLLGFLLGIVGMVISFFHFAHEIEEDAGLALLFKLRGARKAPSEVVVVSIDRESSEHLNVSHNPDRWPRSLHARLVDRLAREGAHVITFDLYFIEATSAEEDQSFAEALRKARNVVLAEPLRAKEVRSSETGGSFMGEHKIVTVLRPIAPLSQSAFATAPFVLPRIPVRVNQYWTFQTAAGDSPTFPVVSFQLYALRVYDDFVRLLKKASPNQAGRLPGDAETAVKTRGAVRLIRDIREIFESDPLISETMLKELEQSDLAASDGTRYRLLKSLIKMYAGANRRYLNFYGPPRTLNTIPFYQALGVREGSESEHRPDLKGKIVFVGFSEILLAERQDSFHTVFSQPNGVFISGVEIAATAFSNLLEDRSLKPISSHYYLITIFAWGILVGFVSRMAPTLIAVPGILVLSVLYLIAAHYRFSADGTWVPVVISLFLQAPVGVFAAVLWSYFETNKERQNIRKALAYYVPDEIVEQLARNLADIKKGGQIVYGACLFADVAGYTTLAEQMAPEQLNDLMHKYLEATFEPIKRNGGLVIELKGDSILAIWKSMRREAAPLEKACLAALGIANAANRFSDSVGTLKLPTRVGVHAGEIFLGNIGAADHYEYGAAGDTVNTASRMDSLNKFLGTQILVTDEVLFGLDGFFTREAGRFRLKGKTHPVVVHELICRIEECEEKQKEAGAIFSEAIRAFRRRSWDEAKEKFRQSICKSGEDGLARFYVKLCEDYKNNPPEEPWEGIIPMQEK